MKTVNGSFEKMDDQQVIRFLIEHQAEMDCEGVTYEEVAAQIESGESVLVREHAGRAVAVVQLELGMYKHRRGEPGACFWMVYVLPLHRRQGVGRAFVRRLIIDYGKTYYPRLYCSGARRRAFFGRLGFIVTQRHEEGMREMERHR